MTIEDNETERRINAAAGVLERAGMLVTAAACAGVQFAHETYLSTSCHHGLHPRCRKECKWCRKPCACACHTEVGTR